MPPITFATTNPEKFLIAKHLCEKVGVDIEQLFIEVDEIQHDNPKVILEAKAKAAFEQHGRPLVVSDDSWEIPALNGFPGPYMKAITHWFTPEDFLKLMEDKTDRTAFLYQHLAYIDEHETVIFTETHHATILPKPQGKSNGGSWMVVASMGNDGKSIAEVYHPDRPFAPDRYDNRPEAWKALIKWYKEKYS